VRQNATGSDLFTALVGLVGRNKRRYGGYTVHLGIVLIFLGFAGAGFKQKEEALLKPGQQIEVGDFTARYDNLKVSDDGAKQMVTATVTVLRDGDTYATMYPAKWFFRKHEEQPTTEVAIQRAFAQDVYIVLAAFDTGSQSASLDVTIAPLVNWIWFGFGIMALGTGIALLPERAYSFAVARLPVEAAATTTALSMLLAMLMFGGSTVSAQRGMGGPADQNIQSSYYARNDFEKKMQHEIVCTCGACGHATIAECRKDPCMTSHEMRAELAALIDQGRNHDEIIQAFITKHGSQEMLGAPLDKGFSRLAWLFPYLVGATSAVAIGFAAVKWTRKPEATTEAAPLDAALEERIDDELRDLD
jgi:cytochrome c-type biogenesis protein CcmF